MESHIVQTIRIDNASKQGVVMDVIQAVTGRISKNVERTFNALPPEIQQSCSYRQLNGKGRRRWLAPVNVLIQIVWCLPGKVAHEFRMKCAQDICRIMGADPSLIAELEAKQHEISPEQKAPFYQTMIKWRLDNPESEKPKHPLMRISFKKKTNLKSSPSQ